MNNFLFVFSLIIFSFQSSVAQNALSKPDTHAINYNAKGQGLNQISDGLTAPFQSETEKARAIFVWITDNIRYDYRKAMNPKSVQISYRTEEEHARKLAALHKKQLNKTLRTRKGICEDYSRLFQTLCKRAGIESKIVAGYARNHPSQVGKVPKVNDHAWNAVKLDGYWYLADATWGAGTVDERGKFLKKIRTEYFKVKPEDLIKTHYPKDDNWQLLSEEVDARGFSEIPMAGFGYLKYGVKDYFPKNAFLNTRKKTVRFKLKISKEIKGRFFLFENTTGKQITLEEENGYLIFDYHLKNKRGKTITLAAAEGTDVYDILTYKIK